MSVASTIKVATLLLNKETGELVPQLEEYLLIIPQVGKSEDFIPKLILVQPNGTRTFSNALQLKDLEECTDARAFAVHSPTETKYFWCTRELSDKEYQKFKDSFATYKRAFLELNFTISALLANIKLFSSIKEFSVAKQLVLNPYFQNHAAAFETCLEQDPSLVDFDYASDLMNHPDRRGCLYDYMLGRRMDNLPKDAKICAILLSSMGINSCEPKVISAMQEYLFRYISKTLTEANSLSDYAGRSELSPADVKMAIQVLAKPNLCASLQELVQRADSINIKPLPVPSTRLGLPKDEDCLLAVNFRVTSLNSGNL